VSLGALRRAAIHASLRLFTAGVVVFLVVMRRLRPTARCRHPGPGCRVLLTGTFHSSNWIHAHLAPLAAAKACAAVTVVSLTPVPALPKVELRRPPDWLIRACGRVPSRLVTFCWVALRERPCFVGGFHLLVNGLVAALVACLVGARSVYFCVGGPAEVEGGGIGSENRLFGTMGAPDAVVERRLVTAVGAFDAIVTMGTSAARFFRERGVDVPIHVVAGGIDEKRFATGNSAPTVDLIMVGRLAPIKRVDLFLAAMACALRSLPGLTAVVVGEGALRPDLEKQSRALGLEGRVRFVGHQVDVGPWLARVRALVLSSDSEGLPLSVMEAMTAGLPVVVSRVGDLPDLVEDGVSGFLVEGRTPEAFSEKIVAVLRDDILRARLGEAARRAARRYTIDAAARKWEAILAGEAPR
jgi:L-malate glycosyltransferase